MVRKESSSISGPQTQELERKTSSRCCGGGGGWDSRAGGVVVVGGVPCDNEDLRRLGMWGYFSTSPGERSSHLRSGQAARGGLPDRSMLSRGRGCRAKREGKNEGHREIL